MRRRCVILILVALVSLALTLPALASTPDPDVAPLRYEATECGIDVVYGVSRSDSAAKFYVWYDCGNGSEYRITIRYGDGQSETCYMSLTPPRYQFFYHYYDTTGKPAGYTWTVTVTVTCGASTATDSTVITLVDQ